MLGIEIEFSNRVRGTLQVSLLSEREGDHTGRLLRTYRCRSAIAVVREPRELARYIARALGLDNVCDDDPDTQTPPCTAIHEGNLMHGSTEHPTWADLTDAQDGAIQRGRRRVTSCR